MPHKFILRIGTSLFLAVLWLIVMNIAVIAQTDIVYDTSDMLQASDPINDTFEAMVTSRLYVFEASAGDVISVAMLQDDRSALDPYLVLLDHDGQVLAYDDDSGSSNYAAQIDGVELDNDGLYFVLATSTVYVEGLTAEADRVQNYALQIVGATAPEVDPDSDEDLRLFAPDVIVANLPLDAESSDDAPVQFFIFEGTQDQAVMLSVQSGSADLFTTIHLFDASGARIAVDPSEIMIDLPEDGVYLVMVGDAFFYNAGGDDSLFTGGEYRLQLQTSP